MLTNGVALNTVEDSKWGKTDLSLTRVTNRNIMFEK